jgi:hypothetical protein
MQSHKSNPISSSKTPWCVGALLFCFPHVARARLFIRHNIRISLPAILFAHALEMLGYLERGTETKKYRPGLLVLRKAAREISLALGAGV